MPLVVTLIGIAMAVVVITMKMLAMACTSPEDADATEIHTIN